MTGAWVSPTAAMSELKEAWNKRGYTLEVWLALACCTYLSTILLLRVGTPAPRRPGCNFVGLKVLRWL